MKKDFMNYLPMIDDLRQDDFYDIFSDEELVELIDDCDWLWDENDDLMID